MFQFQQTALRLISNASILLFLVCISSFGLTCLAYAQSLPIRNGICLSSREIINLMRTTRADPGDRRIHYILEGERAVKDMVSNPPIALPQRRVVSLDTKRSTQGEKPLFSSIIQMQVQLQNQGLIGLSDVKPLRKWLEKVTQFVVQTVRLSPSQRTLDVIGLFDQGCTIERLKTFLVKDLPDNTSSRANKRIHELFRIFPEEEVSHLLEHYSGELRALLKLLPSIISNDMRIRQIKANEPALINVQEKLLSKKIELSGGMIPFPMVKHADHVVLVIVLPGTGMRQSGIPSTFGYHYMVQRLHKLAKSAKHKKIQIVPISIGYPFNGGPTAKKYNFIYSVTAYIESIIDTLIKTWGLDSHPHSTVLMGRSTGGTLALFLHNTKPHKFPRVIAGSPMLSNPDYHLDPAMAIDHLAAYESVGKESYISRDQLVPDILHWSSSLIAQSYIEEDILVHHKDLNRKVSVVWAENDPGYPHSHIWLPKVRKLWKYALDPIVLPGMSEHNVFTNELVFDSQYGDILQQAMLNVLIPE